MVDLGNVFMFFDEVVLWGEIVCFNKVNMVLMNWVECDMGVKGLVFSMFQNVVIFENQICEWMQVLEMVFCENEWINCVLQWEKEEQCVLIQKFEEVYNQLL